MNPKSVKNVIPAVTFCDVASADRRRP